MVAPKISSLVAENDLDLSSTRQVIAAPEGSAALIRAAGGLCFVSVSQALGAVGECVPDGWPAQHQGLGIVAQLPDGSGFAQGVVPQGVTQVQFTDAAGVSTPVSLNSDGAYSVVLAAAPSSVTYLSPNGQSVKRTFPVANRPTSYQPQAGG